MAEQPVSLSISDAGKEQYRNSVQQGGQESYDAILQRREQLKNEKIGLVDYEISRRAGTGESVLNAAGFLKEQKARGIDKVPENLNEKMLSAVASFKEKYAASNPNAGTLSQLLACEKRQYTCEKVIRFRQFIGCAGIIFTPYSTEAHKALPLRTAREQRRL